MCVMNKGLIMGWYGLMTSSSRRSEHLVKTFMLRSYASTNRPVGLTSHDRGRTSFTIFRPFSYLVLRASRASPSPLGRSDFLTIMYSLASTGDAQKRPNVIKDLHGRPRGCLVRPSLPRACMHVIDMMTRRRPLPVMWSMIRTHHFKVPP